MPTNQSSPWGGEKLRLCSRGDGPTATISPSKRPGKVVAAEVPYSQSSLQLSRKKDQAKSLSSNVASSAPSGRQTTAPRPPGPERESRERNKANTRGQVTAGLDGFPNLPKQLNGIQNPNQVPAVNLKQVGSILTEPNSSTSNSREGQTGFNVLLTGTKQTCMPLQTSQNGNCGTESGGQDSTGDGPVGLEPLLSVGHQDPCDSGQPSLQQINLLVLEGADCCSSPSVPPPCLTVCVHQGAALGTSGPHKTEVRSTATTRTNQSTEPTTNCSQTPNGSKVTASNTELLVRGGPPAALAAATNNKPPTAASPGLNKLRQCPPGSTMSTCRRTGSQAASAAPNGCLPSVPSASADATQEKRSTPVDATDDEASSPSGALVGSVTTQISTIHLTRQGESASSSIPCPSSPSRSGQGPTGDTLSGQECGLQADGLEEELPDELENACSDDCDSDCSSSSTASSPALSSVEEPMSQGADDNRVERPALVPSLFSFIPPTLYFSTANEKVELLPVEQRRLLKWKITTVTPNVVKHTIARSHFKVTKKSHDWLGSWGHHMKSAGFRAIREHQKLNHFPGTFQIGRKDRLWRNLSKMQVRFGKQEFGFFPRTFVLPQDIKLLRKVWEDSSTRQKWIIKPPASARGIGIQVIHKWSQMPRKRPLLVQKYLHKPYLISGNKFDLRIYVYVSSYDPLRVYMFSDGLVRFASCKYSSSMKTLSNKFMHLTNYSVNKKNSEYQSNSDDKACQGHKWALKALWQYLGSQGINTTLIREKIKDIVIKTIIASEPYVINLLKMNVRTPYSCHELFGFDIMLDEKLKPWILEVNISPSLHSNTALDVAIKGQMIRDLLNLAGFHIPQREEVSASSSSASSSTSSLCGGTRTKPEVSADEKVKRAFYLTQCYADQDSLSTVLEVLTPDDVRVLAESEDELSRMGQFERLFPSPSSSRYLHFFDCPRYLNILLDQWEQKHRSSRSKGIALLKTLCQNGVHLGTSDPAHMWSKSSSMSKTEPPKQEPVSPFRSRGVVVSHQTPPHHDRGDGDGPDKEVASFSGLPVSPSSGSSVSSSACGSPQPGLS